MIKTRVVEGQDNVLENNILPIQQPIVSEPEFITKEQFNSGINSVVDKLANRLEPASALTPEVRGVVKAVDEIQGLRNALQSPASAGIESATSNLVTTVLGNALQNIAGGGQQAPQVVPLKNTLAQLTVNNLTGPNSPLPQILDALTNVLGKEKVKAGYDTGMQYIEEQQAQNNLPNTVLQFDETKQEDVVAYAQLQGYSDVQYAQSMLIEHKNRLYQEIEEYQNIQQGGQQTAAEEPIVEQTVVEEPIVEQIVVEETIVKQTVVQEPIVEQTVVEEPVVEEPMKANKVIVLHRKPKKLVLVNDIADIDENDEILDIDNIIEELNE